MGGSIIGSLIMAVPILGVAVAFISHWRGHKLSRSAIKMNVMVRIVDFGADYRSQAALEEGLQRTLKRLFHLYSGQSVNGALVWAVLSHHPRADALDLLALAHDEVGIDKTSGKIRHKRPRWKLDSTEAVLFIIYIALSLGWYLMIGPGLRWLYGSPDSMATSDKIWATIAVVLSSCFVILYARYCFRYVAKVRAVRELTQTKRMKASRSLRMRCLDVQRKVKALLAQMRKLLPS
ncbi:hypothetical protein [Vreelandella titanicae]|uniref:hypothetical protein n=1 Tax=Vreelandella titanicae TaxID=664683 RepID=UPI00167FF7C4|nr:hypothetical protein [Halomonas titanicae]QNU62040.1 hypothetical protein HZS52_20185 [Halomonas titanicae]